MAFRSYWDLSLGIRALGALQAVRIAAISPYSCELSALDPTSFRRKRLASPQKTFLLRIHCPREVDKACQKVMLQKVASVTTSLGYAASIIVRTEKLLVARKILRSALDDG